MRLYSLIKYNKNQKGTLLEIQTSNTVIHYKALGKWGKGVKTLL